MGARNRTLGVVPGAADEPADGLTTRAHIGPDDGYRLVVLSRDRELIHSLRLVAFPNEVHAIWRETDLVPSLLAHQAAVILLDAAAVSRSIERITAGLKSQFPDVVLIVAGGPSDQNSLAAQIADGTVHRFLVKPVSPQRIKLFLDAAWRRRGQHTTHLDFTGTPLRAPLPPGPRTGGRRNGWLVVAIAATAALTAWLAFLKNRQPPAGATQAPTAPAPDTAGSSNGALLDSLLERGDTALGRGELDRAAELYREAQRISSSDPHVVEGLQQLVPKMLAAANAQLRDGHLQRAQQLTTEAWTLEPDSQEVAQQLAQLEGERQHGPAPAPALQPAKVAAAAHEAEMPKRTGKLAEYLRRAQEGMDQGGLLDPPQGSALYFNSQARALAPADPAVRRAQRQLLERVIEHARSALTASRPDDAERWIAAATGLGAPPDEVANLTREVQLDREAATASAMDRTASLFNERMSQGRILDPANDSAKFYLAQLLRGGPDKPSTQLARQLFQERTVLETQDAIRRQDYTSAQRWLAEAHDADAGPATLAALQRDIQAGVAMKAAAAPPAPQVQLQLTHFVEPAYPVRTFGPSFEPSQVKGTVNVQFTVDTDGTTTDLKIISAEPPGVFDRAAIAAVSKWRYVPPMQDGRPTQVRTHVRLIFQPAAGQ